MSIKGSSRAARQTVGESNTGQYVPPANETPEGANYTRDLNVAPINAADHVYDRDLNTNLAFDDGYVYNFGPPGSPHERWGASAHRSASYSALSGIRYAPDVVSSASTGHVSHEVDDLPTTKHLPGYH